MPFAQPKFDEGIGLSAGWHRAPDADFLAQAYRDVLGREADPVGFAHSLKRLRLGVHRHDILSAMVGSPEAAHRLGPERSARQAREFQRQPHQKLATLLRRALISRFAGSAKGASAVPFMPAPDLMVDAAPDPGSARPMPSPRWPVQGGTAVMTIAALNYLPQVRLLLNSVLRFHPECTTVLLLVGGNPATMEAHDLGLDARTVVIDATQLDLPSFDDMAVRYDTVELCTGIKPWALLHLFDACGFDAAIYLDPDIELHAAMADVTAAMSQGAAVVVTPHALAPLEPTGLPDDHAILKSGVFNLGFIGMRRCAESLDFLRWWGQKLLTRCLVAFDQNLFTDQRWCDLLPCFVPSLHVLRHPGYNVAYWNMDQRPLQLDAAGQWHAAGQPLVFFHFSGFDPKVPEACSRHQTRIDAMTLASALPLLQRYANSLLKQGWPMVSGPNPYESLPCGLHIPLLLRQFYRQLYPEPAVGSRAQLLQALLTKAFTPVQGGLPPLLRFLHHSRPDIQSAFDLDSQEGVADFTQWVRCCASGPLGLQGIAKPG
jgi:hypothetical protein